MNQKEKYGIAKSMSSDLSNYSTCSDNPENFTFHQQCLQLSRQSVVIAGSPNFPRMSENSIEDPPNSYSNETSNGTSYSVGLFDQTIDPENSIFMDCMSKSDSSLVSETDSTKYLQLNQLEKNFNVEQNKRNDITKENKLNDSLSAIKNSDVQQLTTIVEEKEITSTTVNLVKNKSPLQPENTTGYMLAEIVGNLNNRTSIKRVLFSNEDYDNDFLCNEVTRQKIMKMNKVNPQHNKFGYYIDTEKNKDKICNTHNTTESFVLWEKYCQASDTLTSRRSFSFSELNSLSENYGDDEHTSQSLDDTYVSQYSVNTVHDDSETRTKLRHRSKSCESLLTEVKHLPHILYDRFLRSLAKEIEKIRKENVVCTCLQHSNKKKLNKEAKNTKITIKKPITKMDVQVSNVKQKIETKTLSKAAPLKPITLLSPEVLLIDTRNIQKPSPKSPNKTSTTPVKRRGFSSWHKEIVSPVGEYIKGKRQSPFNNASNVKKL